MPGTHEARAPLDRFLYLGQPVRRMRNKVTNGVYLLVTFLDIGRGTLCWVKVDLWFHPTTREVRTSSITRRFVKA